MSEDTLLTEIYRLASRYLICHCHLHDYAGPNVQAWSEQVY